VSFAQSASQVRVVGSTALQPVERAALLAARGDSHILIAGEPSPAKAALARLIHEEGDGAGQGFVMLKCDRLSDETIDAELFGDATRPGVLKSLFSRTVFLDNVDALSAATQARLAQVLASMKRRGRVIASTAVNLNARVVAGFFSAELYDRLSAVTLVVPSLREQAVEIQSAFGRFHIVDRPTGERALVYRHEWPSRTAA
jgi:two-component system, NtrC family, C4-dicarboxylate transport response regulator DctD